MSNPDCSSSHQKQDGLFMKPTNSEGLVDLLQFQNLSLENKSNADKNQAITKQAFLNPEQLELNLESLKTLSISDTGCTGRTIEKPSLGTYPSLESNTHQPSSALLPIRDASLDANVICKWQKLKLNSLQNELEVNEISYRLKNRSYFKKPMCMISSGLSTKHCMSAQLKPDFREMHAAVPLSFVTTSVANHDSVKETSDLQQILNYLIPAVLSALIQPGKDSDCSSFCENIAQYSESKMNTFSHSPEEYAKITLIRSISSCFLKIKQAETHQPTVLEVTSPSGSSILTLNAESCPTFQNDINTLIDALSRFSLPQKKQTNCCPNCQNHHYVSLLPTASLHSVSDSSISSLIQTLNSFSISQNVKTSLCLCCHCDHKVGFQSLAEKLINIEGKILNNVRSFSFSENQSFFDSSGRLHGDFVLRRRRMLRPHRRPLILYSSSETGRNLRNQRSRQSFDFNVAEKKFENLFREYF